MTRPLIAALLLSCAALAGCGEVGSLDQPAPLFGSKARADYDAKQKAAADARAKAKKDNGEPDSPNGVDPNNPPLTQAPYSAPLPGASTNPNGAPLPGALPTPGMTPYQ